MTPALTIVDDGVGMRRRELARYHDVASSTKIRGAGIGFAGVGIKVALLVCTDVVTETLRGVAVSAFGKVIKCGWDWLGIAPSSPERLGGLIEVPPLAQCLTLNKADFIRAGGRGATYLAYRKAIQEVVWHQLSLWGHAGEPTEHTRRRAARPVERDLEAVLADLAGEFPLLATLVEQRAGGQRRLPVDGSRPTSGEHPSSLLAVHEPGGPPSAQSEVSGGLPEAAPGPWAATEPAALDASRPAPATAHLTPGVRARRPARYGLNIQFEHRPDDLELGRLVESTVWVNEAHPAYRRAVASRSEGYHVALAVAMALASLAVDAAKEHAFIAAFLARWGTAMERRKGPRRR